MGVDDLVNEGKQMFEQNRGKTGASEQVAAVRGARRRQTVPNCAGIVGVEMGAIGRMLGRHAVDDTPEFATRPGDT